MLTHTFTKLNILIDFLNFLCYVKIPRLERICILERKFMRISPISNAYCKPRRKNVSFGKFENEQAKTKMRELIMSRWDKYDDEFKKRPHSGFKESVKECNDAINFFDTTPYVTVKLKNNVLYAAKNDSAIESHPHKEAFDEMIAKCEEDYNDEDFCFASKRAQALYKTEKNFLTAFETCGDPCDIKEKIELAEIGYMESKVKHQEPKTSGKSFYDSADERRYDPYGWAWDNLKN